MTTSFPNETSPPSEDTTSYASTPGPQRAFISGPIDTGPSQAYFTEHYRLAIDAAVARGDLFVIGPIPSGIDADALAYLVEHHTAAARTTVFLTHGEAKLWDIKFRALGVATHVEGQQPRERDAAMTRKSDYDILRWRTDDEARAFYGGAAFRLGYVTNTERNWRRRRGLPENPTAEERAGEEGLVEKQEQRSEGGQSAVGKVWEKVKMK